MTATESILFLIAIISSVIGVLGFFTGKENKTKEEIKDASEWRGTVNAKLDSILKLNTRVDDLEEEVGQHEIAISKLADSSKRVHERLDIILGGRDGGRKDA